MYKVFYIALYIAEGRLKALKLAVFPASYVALRFNYEMYPFYTALCNGLQGAVAQNAANQTRNTGANYFSFR